METRKRVFGEEHPDTLTSMVNLALTYQNLGRWVEAEELKLQYRNHQAYVQRTGVIRVPPRSGADRVRTETGGARHPGGEETGGTNNGGSNGGSGEGREPGQIMSSPYVGACRRCGFPSSRFSSDWISWRCEQHGDPHPRW